MVRGSRHRASLIAESLLDGECQRLTRQAIEMALGGDVQALKMCLERILPPARERPCSFKLPPISTAAEAAACMARVLEGMASGEILPAEGAALSATISAYVKGEQRTNIAEMKIEFTDEVLRLHDLQSVSPEQFQEGTGEDTFAATLLPSQNDNGPALQVWELNGVCHPINDIRTPSLLQTT